MKSTSDQVLKTNLSHTKRKDSTVRMIKQNRTKHIYFSLFNPLKVTGELEIESLEWVQGCELGGGELTVPWGETGIIPPAF